jgi:uncharacterized membrane protein YbhN (UPF0104 family)
VSDAEPTERARPAGPVSRPAGMTWGLRVLKLVATLALLAVLWQVFDGAAALRHLAGAEPGWIAAALLALTAQTVLSAMRWRLTASRLGIELDLRRALAEYYLAQIVNQALPGGVLGDAGRAVRTRADAGLAAAGQAVVFERLAGQVALLALLALGVAGTTLVPGGFDAPASLSLSVTLILAVAAGFAVLVRMSGARLFGVRFARLGAAFVHAVAAPEVRGRQVMASLGTALCNVAAFACCAAAVGVALPPATALVLVPLILLTMVVPATVSGWGLREGAAAALLPLAGASAAEGLAAGVAFGLAFFVATLPGLAFLLVPEGVGSVRRGAGAASASLEEGET